MLTDICFCDNEKCKKKKSCFRALDNHDRDELPEFISIANFKCFNEGEKNYFIRKKYGRK